VTGRLPLFPLGLVLLPGLMLPLHVFEERYRVLVAELLTLPEDERRFGVVAIRSGREVGVDGVRALHDVGCVARLRRAEQHADGRFDIVATGAERFRLTGLEHDRPYLTGLVELVPDEPEPSDEAARAQVRLLDGALRAAFAGYLTTLGRARGEAVEPPDLPTDPLVMGYLVAASVLVDLEDRQRLLAAPDLPARQSSELALLRRETTLLRRLAAAPAPELARAPVSPN
jgi:uncharacterized protein